MIMKLINLKHLNMNLKTVSKVLIVFILILISPKLGNTQTTFSIDSTSNDSLCFTINQAKFLISSTEKYYICNDLNQLNEEEIRLLREVIEEKQEQENLNIQVLNSLRNEVTRLRRQRTFLSVGLGGAIVALFILAF